MAWTSIIQFRDKHPEDYKKALRRHRVVIVKWLVSYLKVATFKGLEQRFWYERYADTKRKDTIFFW